MLSNSTFSGSFPIITYKISSPKRAINRRLLAVLPGPICARAEAKAKKKKVAKAESEEPGDHVTRRAKASFARKKAERVRTANEKDWNVSQLLGPRNQK
ncbi:hypothetical protein AVEN_51698-1 [Araneus ventricosus]|uniref:Uncharacterized protein n=1 Tax=Araneus ventricosus TaxID=182803 RepID=A0A4Y2STC8_ARAVE|nr:hypothetical protein AVEN_150724-1 [Araneus ventricosus]GBN90780.1 hypothetical protein AVEN_51698-1 [Araneus ventricosus]